MQIYNQQLSSHCELYIPLLLKAFFFGGNGGGFCSFSLSMFSESNNIIIPIILANQMHVLHMHSR